MCNRFGFALLALPVLLGFSGGVEAQLAPDLTTTDLSTIDRTYTYNLGPTGMRGWMYRDGRNVGDLGTMTAQQPWQILITTVGANTPASGLLASDDVILGASAGSGPVSLFTNDSRKSLGWAIVAAEAGDGTLKLKRWRAGATNEVQLQLRIMGAYSATAPYNCPKSALILSNACNLIANQSFGGTPGGPVLGLALLASGNTNYLSKVRTYARSLAPANLTLDPNSCDTWGWGYRNVFLSEYYLLTGDANVLAGIKAYTVALAKAQSLYGTYGHGGAERHADGSFHGSISWYGPVNSAGLVANLGIVMGKKCMVASGGAVDPEIDPAIGRGAKFFGYYVGKGSIPYGEHEPWSGGHASNGKDQMAALMFALQGNRPAETEYFTRMSVTGYNGREYGHTGQGFSYLWGALAANIGGTNAVASHLAPVRWHLDLSRRSDGSFVYDGGEQYGGSNVSDYWGSSDYAGIDPTASYVLTYALPKQKLYLTGKNANTNNWLSSAVVSNCLWVGTFNQVCAGYSTNQLIAAMGEYDPGVRSWAADTLGARAGVNVSLLISMANSTNYLLRQSACQALGVMKNTAALPVLGQRLNDTNIWVRSKAAKALQNFGGPALPQLTNMLTAFITNATDPHVIVWEDPIQIANGYLADALFNTLGASTIGANTNLLYPALRVGLSQPDGMALNYLSGFIQNRLTLTHVQAVASNLVAAIAVRSPADRMFSDEIRFVGANTLGKYRIEEGIPLSLMLKEQTWHSDDLRPFDNLINNYRGAAKDALPTLYKWQDHIPQFAADDSINACCPGRLANITNKIAAAIVAISSDPSPPTLVSFKKIAATNAKPSAVTLPAAYSLLSVTESDLDSGVPAFTWSKVAGPGTVRFNPNGTTASSNSIASFDTPGAYVLEVAAVDSSILDSNIWITYSLGYYDFKTYTNMIGAVSSNVTVTVAAGPVTPPTGSLTNLPATGVTTNLAVLNARLGCAGAPYNVRAYWNTVSGGTNATLWTNSAYLGAWADVVATNLSLAATGLTSNTLYYFTFRATNPGRDVWAANVQSFTTIGPPPPDTGVPLPFALNNSNLVWLTDTNTFWSGQTNVSHDGVAAAQSHALGDGQQSALSTTVAGPGTLSFWWKVSSETNADWLRFTASGSSPGAAAQLSGEGAWTQATFLLPAGPQTLQWTYTKNASGSAGSDAAWLDQVTYTTGFTLPFILAQPASQSCLVGAPLTFAVSASGTPVLTYQWRHDGNPILGATNAALTLANAGAADQGGYSVRVANAFGFIDSSNAALAILLLVASGDNSFGQLNLPAAATNLVAIAAGAWHNLALRGDGQVLAWGHNYDGQCNVPASLRDAVAIAAGGYHSLALRLDGQLLAWGTNDGGQTNVPPGLANVMAVAAGTRHSLALRTDGTVIGWGGNAFGQATPPVGLRGAVAIAAGGHHSLALRADGTVAAWGENTDAYGSYAGQSVVPSGLTNVVAIAAGDYHSLAVKSDGTVALWGDNSQGQCSAPAGLAGVTVAAAGGAHTLALRGDSTAVAWGKDWNNQCRIPPGLSSVVALAAGNSHSLLLAGIPPPAPRPLHPARQGSQFSLLLPTVAGWYYALEYKATLAATNWTALPPIYGTGTLQFLVDLSATVPQRFYHVRQW